MIFECRTQIVGPINKHRVPTGNYFKYHQKSNIGGRSTRYMLCNSHPGHLMTQLKDNTHAGKLTGSSSTPTSAGIFEDRREDG